MSELKAINAYQLTTNTEGSDVFIHNDEFGCGGDLVECYLKSEADKVIAELKADYQEACNRLQTANLIKDEQLAETRHQKWKRCMAMAMMLEHVCPITIRKAKWKGKWYLRWLELAEKFKEGV